MVHKRGRDDSSALFTGEEILFTTAHPTQSRINLSVCSGLLWERKKKYDECITQVVEGHTKTWLKKERKSESFLESEIFFFK